MIKTFLADLRSGFDAVYLGLEGAEALRNEADGVFVRDAYRKIPPPPGGGAED